MGLPRQVTLVEVGPRDGLQNEPQIIPTELKIRFINALSETGLSQIEVTSFVSPKWIPQMGDHTEVVAKITRHPNVHYSALVPNSQGLDDAIHAKIEQISVFTTASETFSQKNTNCSIEESLYRITEVTQKAKTRNILVRGYISCVLGCPYEGDIAFEKTAQLSKKLIELGCYQISLGDTIGVGTAYRAQQLIDTVSKHVSLEKLAIHFHDTYAQALTNIYACLEKGITTIDSSVGGLGGCPYAPGAGGNVATEDVLYLLNGLGIKTGVDLQKLMQAGQLIWNYLKRSPRSKVALALRASLDSSFN